MHAMHPQLMRKLSRPSKVASILDWKKDFNHTVLAVNFHKNRVGIAVASHPSLGDPSLELEPLRFGENDGSPKSIAVAIDQKCLDRFSGIIEDYKVCGVVVNWPLQRDTGRMGAACGRVIFALEQLLERSNENISAKTSSNGGTPDANNHEPGGLFSRPFCLWDAGHMSLKQNSDPSKRIDSFGRCPSYGKENVLSSHESAKNRAKHELAPDSHCNKDKNYFAGREQYHEDELTVVLGVWNDFCRKHWPDICRKNYMSYKVEEASYRENVDPLSLDSDLELARERPSRLKKTPKNKKSLIAMR